MGLGTGAGSGTGVGLTLGDWLGDGVASGCDFAVGLPEYRVHAKQHCSDGRGESGLQQLAACYD